MRREQKPAGSDGHQKQPPTCAQAHSRPQQICSPIRLAISGVNTNRVVIHTADIRRISQKRSRSPGSSAAADQASSGPSASILQTGRSLTPLKIASPITAMNAAIAVMGAMDFWAGSVAMFTAIQLAAATHAAARITAQNALPALIEFGAPAGITHSVPTTATSPRQQTAPALRGRIAAANIGLKDNRKDRRDREQSDLGQAADPFLRKTERRGRRDKQAETNED